jgi:phosphatidate phosphatase APP1
LTAAVFGSGDACRRKQGWLRLLQRLNRFHPTDQQRELFERRVGPFVAATSGGKRLALRVGDEVHSLRKATKRNGLVIGQLALPAATVERFASSTGCLRLDVLGTDGSDTGFGSSVRLIPPTGVSVVSDIDDTIKVTHVSCRRSLLESTFLREFEAVPGMGEAYARWARAGAAFHYVSSSPWQLYGPLAEFFEQAGLPTGSFHLRAFRLHDPMLRRVWMLRKRAKDSALSLLLRAFPERQFVLVGDSGERDPEIYGALARRFGDQVLRILIRDLPQRRMSARRSEWAFRGMPRNAWQVFELPDELPEALCRGREGAI